MQPDGALLIIGEKYMSQAKKLVTHSSIYAVGNLSRQLVGFLMLPVYTRFLEPADYGVVGLLIFMVSLIELLFGGHMFHAVPKFYYEKNEETDRKELLSTALLVTTVISSAAVILAIVFSSQSSMLLFGDANYANLVSMFSILVLTHALENYALIYIRIQQKPWLFVGVNTAKLCLQLGLNVYLVVYLELGVYGVAISAMTSSLIFAAFMTAYTIWHVGIHYSREVAFKLLKFSWPLWVGGIAGLYIGSANRYYIRIFSSLDDVGLFELAGKFGAIILLLVWTPFAQYWQTERFNIYKQDDPLPIFQGVFKVLSTLLVVAGLGVALFAEPTIRIISDEKFHAASHAVPYLVFGAVFQCLTIFNNFSFLVKEKTVWMSRNSYITAAIVTIFYLLLIPEFGYVGASVSLMLAFFFQYVIVFFAAKKHYDMELKLGNLFVNLGISATAIVVANYISIQSIYMNIGIRFCIYVVAALLIVISLFFEKSTKSILLSKFSSFRGV